MELWIRSQDKLDLLKCKSIHIEEIPSSKEVAILCYASGDKYSTVGYYKYKKALEILDEIQRILQPMIKAYTPLTESKEDYKNHCMKTELVGYETTYDIVALPTYIYEMPKK